ncbi:MAG TPA: beta galactosidase jelly roll domain-containing protein, partial [Tepidisphaeraceae bacterium]|nr:beta galactosidase jelly roll domain-containing protein [Tepidisphaeraceae bacterium]
MQDLSGRIHKGHHVRLHFLPWQSLIPVFLFILVGCATHTQPRQRVSFDANWRFTRGDPDDVAGRLEYSKIKPWIESTGSRLVKDPAQRTRRPDGNLAGDLSYIQPRFDDSSWTKVNLPHDYGIEGPFQQSLPGATGKLPWAGIAWYRKNFFISQSDRRKDFYLDIDGAMSYSAVWLNGHFIGGWPYGYTSYELNLTPYLNFDGDNVLAIRLDNPPDSSRWYPGGGIYRNVWLVQTGPVHIAHWGTYITTPEVSSGCANVDVQVHV